MFFRILTIAFLGSISICFSQDQIILRNKDTIDCKLTNLDQYYTYFISPENTSHILHVSNVHVKKIHNRTFTKQKEWLFPNKDTSDYKNTNKVTIAKFKKNPGAQDQKATATAPASQNTVTRDSSSAPSSNDAFFLATFSFLPINANLVVNNASIFKYNNTKHGNFALNFEYVNPNSIGFSASIGYSTYSYHASFTSPDRVLNASFLKYESGVALGFGPNVSYRTSKSSFVKVNVGVEGLIRPEIKIKEAEINRGNQALDDVYHTGNETNSESKAGINLGISYHKQLNDIFVFAFGVGYKGMKQTFLTTNKLKNDVGNIEINDKVGFQTEHYLTTFLSIGAIF